LRVQLQGWANSATESAAPPMTAGRVNMRPMWIRLAAAASVVLVLGWFSVQWAGTNYSDEALFSAQYESPEASTFRSGTAMENPLEPGFKALEDNHLQVAEDFFKTVSPVQERYAEAQYYLGHAAMQLGHYNLAVDAFKSCIQRNEVKFKEKAEWNLLLTYVAAGQTDDPDFRNLLDTMRNDNGHSYQREATQLSKKLESFWRKIER
jgi:tetratricopeptide (TPR) repeat protein